MPSDDAQAPPEPAATSLRDRLTWRRLGLAWAGLAVLAACGAGVLQGLGAPRDAAGTPQGTGRRAEATPAPPRDIVAAPTLLRPSNDPGRRDASAAPPAQDGSQAPPGAPPVRAAAAPVQIRDVAAVIADPLAALLEPGPDGLSLPRVGADGLAPMQAYARPFAAPPGTKLVAIVLDGIGLSESDSLAAIDALPGAVDLAVSPYAVHPDALLHAARLKGHELLASIPMEPAGSPLNDEGGRALSAAAPFDANQAALEQVLGHIQGYAGATGGSDGQRGERFALSGQPFVEVERDLAARGLFYVETAGAGVAPGLAARGVDLVVDEPAGAASLDARLARLEAMAQEHGTALGLAGPPSPVTVERLATWAKGLASRGLVLAPASALVRVARPAPSAFPASVFPAPATPAAARDPSGRKAP